MVKKSRLKNSGCFLSLAIVVGAYVILSLLSFGHMLGRKYVSLFVPVCCYIVASLGLNLNIGISGELNLGQAGFMAIGAFTAAVVSGYMTFITTAPTFVIVVLSILAGTVLSALIGWLISVPVLRLRGDYLAIVTLAFGQIIVSLLNNIYLGVDQNGLHFSFINHSFVLAEGGKEFISGPMGVMQEKAPANFTTGIVLVILALWLIYSLLDAKDGRAIMACRDNRIAAESIGIPVSSMKAEAFVISAALAGGAGALYGLNYASFTAGKFDFNLSILILVYVVLGGLGNMTGTIIATTILVVLPEALRFLATYRMLLYALVLIVMMLVTNRVDFQKIIARYRKGTNHER